MTEDIAPERLIAILRTPDPGLTIPLAEAIIGGGISSIEVALTTPDALRSIAAIASRWNGRACVGAGTVRSAEDASRAIDAGARFLVGPDFNPDVLHQSRRAGIPYLPGALTPNEVGSVLAAGVELIKIFPAGRMGPAYLHDLLGPFPQLQPVPTGGIDFSNAVAFLRSGAVALGVGSALTVRTGRSGLRTVTARAKRLRLLVARSMMTR